MAENLIYVKVFINLKRHFAACLVASFSFVETLAIGVAFSYDTLTALLIAKPKLS